MALMNLFSGQEQRRTHRNRLVDTERKGGNLRGYVYTTMCKIDSWGKLLYGAGSSGRCLVMTQRGGMDGWEGGSRRGDTLYTYIWLLCPWGHKRAGHNLVTKQQLSPSYIGLPRWYSDRIHLPTQATQETQVQFPRLGRSPEVGNGNPLQYSCLENAVARGACQVTVLGVTNSQTQLSD